MTKADLAKAALLSLFLAALLVIAAWPEVR